MCLGCQGEDIVPTPEVDLEMQSLQLAVRDAKNSSQSIVGLQVRIDGEAVDASQLYAEGKVLKAGALALNNQACQLSCKNPGLKNAEFTVWASAPGYVSNFKHVRVSALDSLQYVDLALVKVGDAPEEVKWQYSLMIYSNASSLVPGGLQSAHTNQGEKTFLLASAVQSTTPNAPLALNLLLGEDTHNPDTGLSIQAGDPIEIWFLAENTGSWVKLKNQVILTDGLGRKQIAINLEKAGTLLAGYGLDPCFEPLKVTLEKSVSLGQTLCVRLLQGNKQVLAQRRIAAKSRGPFVIYLPKNLDYTLSMHSGNNTILNKVYQNDLPNCASLALIKNNN
jgi:hypothetical protein